MLTRGGEPTQTRERPRETADVQRGHRDHRGDDPRGRERRERERDDGRMHEREENVARGFGGLLSREDRGRIQHGGAASVEDQARGSVERDEVVRAQVDDRGDRADDERREHGDETEPALRGQTRDGRRGTQSETRPAHAPKPARTSRTSSDGSKSVRSRTGVARTPVCS